MEKVLKEQDFTTLMKDLNHCKARARKAGYTGDEEVEYPSYLRNGQVIEIAVCHMLGILQRYTTSYMNISVSMDLDVKGVDLQIETKKEIKTVQMKHSSTMKRRHTGKGEFLVLVEAGGYRIMYNFFKYYRLPWPQLKPDRYMSLRVELDVMFNKYREKIYN